MLHGLNIEGLYAYAQNFTTRQSDLLSELERETFVKHAQPHMLSGHLQGRFLSLLSKLIQPKCIVEIGTYTGYSALCLAEGLVTDGILYTLELDAEKEMICTKYFQKSDYTSRIQLIIGDALKSLEKITAPIQLVFLDADKNNYCNYYNAIFDKIESGGIIIADNVLFHGQVLDDKKSKNAQGVHDYNTMLQNDTRVEIILLPLRDGLSIARKK
jgi:caffeoyl-CoA O-methyltransferase